MAQHQQTSTCSRLSSWPIRRWIEKLIAPRSPDCCPATGVFCWLASLAVEPRRGPRRTGAVADQNRARHRAARQTAAGLAGTGVASTLGTTSPGRPRVRRRTGAAHRDRRRVWVAIPNRQSVTTLGQRVTHERRSRVYAHAATPVDVVPRQETDGRHHQHCDGGRRRNPERRHVRRPRQAVLRAAVGRHERSCSISTGALRSIALAVLPALGVVVYTLTRRIKRASRDVRGREADLMSTMQRFFRRCGSSRRSAGKITSATGSSIRASGSSSRCSAHGTPRQSWRRRSRSSSPAGPRRSSGSARATSSGPRHRRGPRRLPAVLEQDVQAGPRAVEADRHILASPRSPNGSTIFSPSKLEVRDRPGARRAPRFRGAIELDRVRFGYATNRPIVSKPTEPQDPRRLRRRDRRPNRRREDDVINLVARFYDPQSGRVLIDGEDVQSFYQESLRERIGSSCKTRCSSAVLSGRTSRMARPQATRHDIVRAAEMSQRPGFIRELPDGYNTMVGERGVTLSGGQQQRSRSRGSIVRDAPILVLDEPTTGLDAASEATVLDALSQLMRQDDHHDRAQPRDGAAGGQTLRDRPRPPVRTRHTCVASRGRRRVRAAARPSIHSERGTRLTPARNGKRVPHILGCARRYCTLHKIRAVLEDGWRTEDSE